MLPNQTIFSSTSTFAATPELQTALLPELDFDAAMVATRTRVLRLLASSKMPTNLKQRYIELEILKESVDLAISSETMRRVIVEALLDNVEKGPGHLSIHRAKRALKEISRRLGLNCLNQILQSRDFTDRTHAAHLFGWSKSRKAYRMLLQIHRTADCQTQEIILLVLRKHYAFFSPQPPN